MKKALLFSLLATSLSAFAQEQFIIKGDVSHINMPVKQVSFKRSVEGVTKVDSVQVINGRYEFKGETENPFMGSLMVQYVDPSISYSVRRDNIVAFIYDGTVQIHSVDSFSNAKVTGSAPHDLYLKFREKEKMYDEQFKTISKRYTEASKENNQAEMDAIILEAQSIDKQKREEIYGSFLKSNTKSPMALYALGQYAGYKIDPVSVEPLFNNLDKKIQESWSGKDFKQRLEGAKRRLVGSYATDFTQADTLGKAVSLSSFKGKYVLVDFWASWCGPCRKENPNVVEAFQKYSAKNFTVLGVSLERENQHEAWMKAIHKDNLTWTHVSDFKYFNNEAAKLYGIAGIPSNMLLDPSGKIIANDLRGAELHKKLEELLGE